MIAMMQCNRDIDPVYGPFEPCLKPAVVRLWIHYGQGPLHLRGRNQPEHVDEGGSFCADCASRFALSWQESFGMEVLTTKLHRLPQVACPINRRGAWR